MCIIKTTQHFLSSASEWRVCVCVCVAWTSELQNSVKLSEMKLSPRVSDHVPERQKTIEGLCEYEHGEHDVDASLQGLDEDGFIEELKQDQWELQQDAQQPKSSQLRDLFLQVPRITEEESNRLDQSHQDENGDEDELVVVGQGRILELQHDRFTDPPQGEEPHVEVQRHLEVETRQHPLVVWHERVILSGAGLSPALVEQHGPREVLQTSSERLR